MDTKGGSRKRVYKKREKADVAKLKKDVKKVERDVSKPPGKKVYKKARRPTKYKDSYVPVPIQEHFVKTYPQVTSEMAKSKARPLGYVGTSPGQMTVPVLIADVMFACQQIAGYYNLRRPYAFASDPLQASGTTPSGGSFFPSTLAAYMMLACFQYFKKLGQLQVPNGGAISNVEDFFNEKWQIPKALAIWLAYVGRSDGPPQITGLLQLPTADFIMATGNITATNPPTALNVNQLQISQNGGFSWFSSSNTTIAVQSGSLQGLPVLVNNTFAGLNFPFNGFFGNTNPFFGNNGADGPPGISVKLQSLDWDTVPLSTVPLCAPDNSGFCYPFGSSAGLNWWNADCIGSPAQIFSPWMALVCAPNRVGPVNGLVPPSFMSCAPQPSWFGFAPNQTSANFICIGNTNLCQAWLTFMYLADKSPFWVTGKPVRFERYATIEGVHAPTDWCDILVSYIDFYSIYQKALLVLQRYTTIEQYTKYLTTDNIAQFYWFVEEALRARINRDFQIDYGFGAGCVPYIWGHMNNFVNVGILDKSFHVALTWLFDEVGINKIGKRLYIPQLNMNYASAICSGSGTLNSNVLFPFYSTSTSGPSFLPVFNGPPGSSSNNITNALVWFPYTNSFTPLESSVTSSGVGPSYPSGEPTQIVQQITDNTISGNIVNLPTSVSVTYLQTIPQLQASQGLGVIYVAFPALAGTFKSQVNTISIYAEFTVDAVALMLSVGSVGDMSQKKRPNTTLWGGPGVSSTVIRNAFLTNIEETMLNVLIVNGVGYAAEGVTTLGSPTNRITQFTTTNYFFDAIVQSPVILNCRDLAHVLAAGISCVYRTNVTETFVLASPSTFRLGKAEDNSQFKVVLGEFVNSSSEVMESFKKEQDKHDVDESNTMFIVPESQIEKAEADCLRKALNNVMSRIGGQLIKPTFVNHATKACRYASDAALMLGLPVPPPDVTCNLLKTAIGASQSFYHHYTDKKKKTGVEKL
jgi:hypothetical protein